MSIASNGDVEASLMRFLEDDEKPWVQALLDRAEALILSKMSDAVNRCRTDFYFMTIMKSVEAEAVSRVLRAPGGGLYKYETEGTYTYSVNQAVASGILEITPRDWDALFGGTKGWAVAGAEMDGYAQDHYAVQGTLGNLTIDPKLYSGASRLEEAGVTVLPDDDEVSLW